MLDYYAVFWSQNSGLVQKSGVTLQQQNFHSHLFGFFFRFYLFIFRERGRKGEREGEKHQCVVASSVPPTGNLAGAQTGWNL